MAIYTSTRERSNTSSGVFATVYINSLTAQSQVRIQGQIVLELTGTNTSHPNDYIPVYILDSTGTTLVSFNIYSSSGWSSGFNYTHNFDVSFSNTVSGYNGSLIFQIKNSSETLSWVYPYRPVIKSVSWSGYSGSGSNNSNTPGFDWGNNDYTPSITYPSNPSSFTTSTNAIKFKSGTSVILNWGKPSTFGDFSENYYYELVANGKTLYKGTDTTFTVIINSSTVYTIYCKSGTGITSGSGRQLSLIVPDNIGIASIVGVGKSNSNPGFSPIGINEKILISWSKPNIPANNSIKNYSIYFNDKLIKSEIKTTSYTLENYNLTGQSYKVTIRAYDEVGNYTTSKPCYLYTVNPSFNYGPSSESSVLLDKTKINWGELKTNSLNTNLLKIKYTLKYTTTSTITVAENDGYEEIKSNLINTSYIWDTSTFEDIEDGDLIYLKVVGYVYYNNIEITSTEITNNSNNQLFKGILPVKFDNIIFSIPPNDYYGQNPMNIKYTVDSNKWELNNSILNFVNSLRITCNFSNSWTSSNKYYDCVKLKWKKGAYTGEKIQRIIEGEKFFIIDLKKDEEPLLFSQSSESIRFEIYSLYETKKSDGTGSGIYIYSDNSSLSFDDYPGTNGFIRANLPSIFNNGTSIPTINSTFVRNVNFFENTLESEDYQLKDLRADNVISDVPVVGFKIYVTKDKNDYKNGQIVNTDGYLKQTNGTVTFEDGFYKISDSLIPSGNQSAEETTSGFVGFYPQILDDGEYLRQLFFGNISTSLKTLSTNETFYYVITAIDALKQESKGYVLEVKYDFRLAAKFQDSPILINNGFNEVTINQKTGYLFYGQTEDGADWIIFEWYPAFNQNDYLANPGNYIFYNNKYYLKYSEKNSDPNFYTLYKWIDNGKVYSKRLTSSDYTIETETINEVFVQKYVGKYQMNLKDINVDEFFNLTLMPSYIDSYNEEKMDTPKKDLYPINEKDDKGIKNVNFYLSRLVPASINYDSNERQQEEKFKVTLKINNWGFSDDERISKKTAVMKLNNSSLTNGYIKKDLVIKDEYESKLLVFDFAEQLGLIFDKMPFSTVTTVEIIATRSLVNNYTYTTGTSTITTIFNYYLPANFSTLSLRKNKVGVNYSDLTKVEEALYVVAKDRIDSGNDTGNVAVYGNTYPHVFSIQGNLDTKMPNFSKDDGKHLDDLTKASIYMGFYTVNNDNKPYRVGSFGMEEGYPYFVYKGKYFKDVTKTNIEGSNEKVEKRYNNKDYFEKISIADLPIPVGTIMLFPREPLLTEEKDNSGNGTGVYFLDQTKLTEISRTWFLCRGISVLTEKSNGTLLKHLYGKFPNKWPTDEKETEEGDLLYKTPLLNTPDDLYYEDKSGEQKGFCYIIKGDT